MIVLVVQHVRVAVFKLKCKSPIPADPDRPPVLRPPFERMQPVARHIHIANYSSGIQGCQLQSKSSRMFGLNAGLAARLIVATQALMPERLDNWQSIARCASRNNCPILGIHRRIKPEKARIELHPRIRELRLTQVWLSIRMRVR
jgi:hypothetical protein